MSRHADGKTHLETECLSKLPISQDAVQVVYDLRDNATTNADVLRTWIKNLCLSHERLRAERDGATALIDANHKEIASVLTQLLDIGETADLWGDDMEFQSCCDRLRKLLPEDDE